MKYREGMKLLHYFARIEAIKAEIEYMKAYNKFLGAVGESIAYVDTFEDKQHELELIAEEMRGDLVWKS